MVRSRGTEILAMRPNRLKSSCIEWCTVGARSGEQNVGAAVIRGSQYSQAQYWWAVLLDTGHRTVAGTALCSYRANAEAIPGTGHSIGHEVPAGPSAWHRPTSSSRAETAHHHGPCRTHRRRHQRRRHACAAGRSHRDRQTSSSRPARPGLPAPRNNHRMSINGAVFAHGPCNGTRRMCGGAAPV